MHLYMDLWDWHKIEIFSAFSDFNSQHIPEKYRESYQTSPENPLPKQNSASRWLHSYIKGFAAYKTEVDLA